jgi:hypothetical protein
MKLVMISFVLAGAGGLVVHANGNVLKPIELNAPNPPDFLGPRALPLQDVNTFILAPYSPCDGPANGEFDSNYIFKECINIEKKWFKAI